MTLTTVHRSYRFEHAHQAWDFMRAVDCSGGDAIAGYPTLEDRLVVHTRINADAIERIDRAAFANDALEAIETGRAVERIETNYRAGMNF